MSEVFEDDGIRHEGGDLLVQHVLLVVPNSSRLQVSLELLHAYIAFACHLSLLVYLLRWTHTVCLAASDDVHLGIDGH